MVAKLMTKGLPGVRETLSSQSRAPSLHPCLGNLIPHKQLRVHTPQVKTLPCNGDRATARTWCSEINIKKKEPGANKTSGCQPWGKSLDLEKSSQGQGPGDTDTGEQ